MQLVASTETHMLTVADIERGDGRGRVTCTCGWVTPRGLTFSLAVGRGHAHLDEVDVVGAAASEDGH